MFSQKEKTKLERKHAVHFPRRTLNNEKRKPNYKDPNKQPNPKLSMKVLDWVICLDLYILVFFSHSFEFFLESELYVFFQDLCFTFETPLKINIVKY